MRCSSSPNGTRTGFTLVELLVVIGVVGILISLVVPAIRGARVSASEGQALSRLRDARVAFEVYGHAHDGAHPWAPASAVFATSPPPGPTSQIWTTGWDVSLYWPCLFHSVAPWDQHYAAWVSPGTESARDRPWLSADEGSSKYVEPFAYSQSFIARPSNWDGVSEADARSMYRPTRSSEVRTPSLKVMLWDRARAYLPARSERERRRTPMCFADGHASLREVSSAAAPAPNALRPGSDARLHDTPSGIHGRDY